MISDRNHIVSLAKDLIERLNIGLDKFEHGSDVEYSYIREMLDKLNVLVEMEVK
jgi:hypothetical protein